MSTTTKTSKAASVPPASPGSTTVATIQQAMALIVQAFALIQGILRGPFTARENRAMVKGRHAVKVLAPTLIQEAINKPNLVPDQMTPAQMQEETAVAAAFLQFANQLAGIFDRVDGTNRSMQSELVKVALGGSEGGRGSLSRRAAQIERFAGAGQAAQRRQEQHPGASHPSHRGMSTARMAGSDT
jgi:hypothetical protein